MKNVIAVATLLVAITAGLAIAVVAFAACEFFTIQAVNMNYGFVRLVCSPLASVWVAGYVGIKVIFDV